MKIIGIMGMAEAGKDSTADAIESQIRVVRFAFADRLRSEIASAFGIDVRILMDRSLRNTPLEQLALRRCTDVGFCSYAWELSLLPGVRPRNLMQRWGDYRRMQNPDYFIPPAESARIRGVFSEVPLMVCTDVRYENEAAWVWRHGGWLWRVTRPELVVTDSHSSERSTRDIAADVTIVNSDSLDALRRIVVDLLTPVVANEARL